MNGINKIVLIVLFSWVVCIPAPQAVAQENTDIYSIPKAYAVQNRKFTLGSQLTGYLGYMPMDSFTKGYQFGAAFTTYFSDFSGWEVVNANYVLDEDTGLKGDILDISGGQAAADKIPDFPEWMVTTNFVYTPIYTKNLFFNKNIVWGDLSFVSGGGIASYKEDDIRPIANIGAILKFFLSEQTSFRVELREYLAFLSDGLEPFMALQVGYTYQFGSSKKKQGDQDDIEAEFTK